jgi:hypothetical protein
MKVKVENGSRTRYVEENDIPFGYWIVKESGKKPTEVVEPVVELLPDETPDEENE